MWVELAGPPGVGKSTTFAAFRGPKINLSANAEPPKTWGAWIAKTDAVFASLCRSRRANFHRATRIAAAIRARVLSDSLLTQRAQSMAAVGATPDQVRQYLETMPLPDAVVFLDNGDAEIVRRNKQRGRDMSGELDSARWSLEIARQVLTDRGVLVKLLRSDLEPGEVAEDVRGLLFG